MLHQELLHGQWLLHKAILFAVHVQRLNLPVGHIILELLVLYSLIVNCLPMSLEMQGGCEFFLFALTARGRIAESRLDHHHCRLGLRCMPLLNSSTSSSSEKLNEEDAEGKDPGSVGKAGCSSENEFSSASSSPTDWDQLWSNWLEATRKKKQAVSKKYAALKYQNIFIIRDWRSWGFDC